MSKIVLTNVGKRYLNKQYKGPSLSLLGFVPFKCGREILNASSDKSDLIADAMSEMWNNYYFNGINYVLYNGAVKVTNDDDYKDLFELTKNNKLFTIKYTNTKDESGVPFSIYNLHLGIEDIKVDFSKTTETPFLELNGIAIFCQSNIVKGYASESEIELFGLIYFDTVDLVKNDINWFFACNDKGFYEYTYINNESFDEFTDLNKTEKSNVYSATSMVIGSKPVTFSDKFFDNSKTVYYENDWQLGFVKGDLNNNQYDMTLINDSARENGFYFNNNPKTLTMELQNTNRDGAIIFGSRNENMKAKNVFILNSTDITAKSSYGVFSVKTKESLDNSKYVFSIANSTTQSNINSSDNITHFGEGNTVTKSENVFIRGNNNNVSGSNIFIAGDGNYAYSDNTYIFGNSLTSNVDSSVMFGHNYKNTFFSFVYSDGTKTYGFEKDYGNFVIQDENSGPNVQISKDSIYLMNGHRAINPSATKNSLLIGNVETSAENSLIYEDVYKYQNSFTKNGISVYPEAVNVNNLRNSRVNFLNECGMDIAAFITNVSSYNSILQGNSIYSVNGLNIRNSNVRNFSGNEGYISDSIILDGNFSHVDVNNSLVLTNNAKNTCTTGKIHNSIIQGNTQNSTFINSHLIGDLPSNVNLEFKDCIVIANGNDYVEIHPDKVVKKYGEETTIVKWQYGVFEMYMNELCGKGLEWKHDNIEETYEQKIKDLLTNDSLCCKSVTRNEFIFSGKIPSGKTKCVVSMYINTEIVDFILDCLFDYTNEKVVYNIRNFNPRNSTTIKDNSYYLYETNIIENNFEFYIYGGNKVCIKNSNSIDTLFVVYGLCNCEILNDKSFGSSTSKLITNVNYYTRNVNINNIYFISDNYENVTNINEADVEEYITNNLNLFNNTVKIGTLNVPKDIQDIFDKAENMSIPNLAKSQYINFLYNADKDKKELKKLLYITDTNEIRHQIFSNFDEYDIKYDTETKKFSTVKNDSYFLDIIDNPKKYNLVGIDNYIDIDYMMCINNYKIRNLFVRNLYEESFDDGDYINFRTDLERANTLKYFLHDDIDYSNQIFLYDYFTPNNTYKSIISKSGKLFAFFSIMIWGSIINPTIYIHTFSFLNEEHQFIENMFENTTFMIPFGFFDLLPYTRVSSYFIFPLDGSLYNYPTFSIKVEGNSYKMQVINHFARGNGNGYNVALDVDVMKYTPLASYSDTFLRHEFSYIGNIENKTLNMENKYYKTYKHLLDTSYKVMRLGEYHYV